MEDIEEPYADVLINGYPENLGNSTKKSYLSSFIVRLPLAIGHPGDHFLETLLSLTAISQQLHLKIFITFGKFSKCSIDRTLLNIGLYLK